MSAPLIRTELSAPSQKKAAYSVEVVAPYLAELGVKSVAEFGAGRLRNVPVLLRNFEKVDCVEQLPLMDQARATGATLGVRRVYVNSEWETAKVSYNAIFLISVLHTIPCKDERTSILKLCLTKLKRGGFIVFDCPQSESYYNSAKGKTAYKDGHLIRRGRYHTFYKNFLSHEVLDMFAESGLEQVKVFRRSHHLIKLFSAA